MALLIPANDNEPVREVQPKNGEDFTLKELYALLDCQYIEVINLPDGRIMVVDEEGKLVDEPMRNERATKLAGFVSLPEFVAEMLRLRAGGVNVIMAGPPIDDNTTEVDYIAGDALICEDSEVH